LFAQLTRRDQRPWDSSACADVISLTGISRTDCRPGPRTEIFSSPTKSCAGSDAPSPRSNRPPLTTTSAPNWRVLSATLVSIFAGGRRIELKNMASPTMAGTKLVPKPRGRRTRAAPEIPRKTRKSIHERGLRRTCKIFGISNTRANRVPTASWRNFFPNLSGWESAALDPVLIFDLSRLFSHGCSPPISRIRANARRTWGMVMEPPTISATLSASTTSSRFQPSSPQRTR